MYLIEYNDSLYENLNHKTDTSAAQTSQIYILLSLNYNNYSLF